MIRVEGMASQGFALAVFRIPGPLHQVELPNPRPYPPPKYPLMRTLVYLRGCT